VAMSLISGSSSMTSTLFFSISPDGAVVMQYSPRR
jgi:hypothetical protein